MCTSDEKLIVVEYEVAPLSSVDWLFCFSWSVFLSNRRTISALSESSTTVKRPQRFNCSSAPSETSPVFVSLRIATVFAVKAPRGIGPCAGAATKANKASGNKRARRNSFNVCLLETISLDRVSAYHRHRSPHPWDCLFCTVWCGLSKSLRTLLRFLPFIDKPFFRFPSVPAFAVSLKERARSSAG